MLCITVLHLNYLMLQCIDILVTAVVIFAFN